MGLLSWLELKAPRHPTQAFTRGGLRRPQEGQIIGTALLAHTRPTIDKEWFQCTADGQMLAEEVLTNNAESIEVLL